MGKPALDDLRVHVKFKLSALWASVMFCYLYGDYFGLYVPGSLKSMLEGQIVPLGAVTQAKLIATSAMMAAPSLMVFASIAAPPIINRWLNVILGLAYTAIILITMQGPWKFYLFLGVIEAALTLTIAWLAWKWPRQN